MKVFFGIVLLLLVYGSYHEIRQLEDFRIKHDCIEYEKTPAKIQYFSRIDFIYKITAAKTVYICSNGEKIIREE